MKTITLNVSEPVYEEFRRASQSLGRPTSELIREAMEAYRREHLRPASDLRQFRARSVGRVLRPLTRGDDLFDEMLSAKGPNDERPNNEQLSDEPEADR